MGLPPNTFSLYLSVGLINRRDSPANGINTAMGLYFAGRGDGWQIYLRGDI
jgi:hypothetical protein